jgi:c-di-GMP-binding flagellar brake protein YcgR
LGKRGGAPQAQADASGTTTTAIFERLNKIEEKLDLLLIAAGMEAEKSKTSTMEIAQINDLSGSGIRMISQTAMSEGWYLRLTFNIPGEQPFYIETLARVIRSGSQDRNGYFESACQFEAICEEDQDRVIAYVFRRQRELAHNRGMED